MEEELFEDPTELWKNELHIYRNPDIWKKYSYSLKNSGELIYKHKQTNFILPNTERMLFGLSLEILVKAILLSNKQNAETYISENGVKWPCSHHDLLSFFKKVKIDLDKNERRLLKLYSMCVSWAGRYPMPMKSKKQPKVRKSLSYDEIMEKFRNHDNVYFTITARDQFYTDITNPEFKVFLGIYEKVLDKYKDENHEKQ